MDHQIQSDVKKLVFDHLDTLKNSVATIAKEWDTKAIPLDQLKFMIDKSKINKKQIDQSKLSLTSIWKLKTWIKRWNNVLDTFYTTCLNQAKKMESTKIPCTFIYQCVNHVKTAYSDGARV